VWFAVDWDLTAQASVLFPIESDGLASSKIQLTGLGIICPHGVATVLIHLRATHAQQRRWEKFVIDSF
jgi:hypothetical protein